MPSPFPGMDPYIEVGDWSDFHGALIFAVRSSLAQQLEPRYVVRAEERVYLERPEFETIERIPDVHLVLSRPASARRGASAVVELEPELYDIPIGEEQHEYYLVIRDKTSKEVITVLEVLSPTNKTPGSRGFEEYSQKRQEILRSHANLVEIDLLRGGRRPTTRRPLHDTTDYCALIHRASLRPKAEVFQWNVRRELPAVKIPLARGDDDVLLNLQLAFTAAYDGGCYGSSLDYSAVLKPPLRRSDVGWARKIVQSLPKIE